MREKLNHFVTLTIFMFVLARDILFTICHFVKMNCTNEQVFRLTDIALSCFPIKAVLFKALFYQ